MNGGLTMDFLRTFFQKWKLRKEASRATDRKMRKAELEAWMVQQISHARTVWSPTSALYFVCDSLHGTWIVRAYVGDKDERQKRRTKLSTLSTSFPDECTLSQLLAECMENQTDILDWSAPENFFIRAIFVDEPFTG
jgi:hypothetical protein